MQPPIKIQQDGNHINVYFSYNEDIVEVMKEHSGWWMYKKMCWMFPVSKKETIVQALKEKKYLIDVLPSTEKIKKIYDSKKSFRDPDVIQVWGLCKKCNQKCFVNRDCMCSRCALLPDE